MSDSWNQTPGGQGASAEQPGGIPPEGIPAGGIPPAGSQTMRIVRKGLFQQAKRSWDYIERCEKDKTLKIRVDDRRSVQAVAATIVLLFVSVFMVSLNPDLKPVAKIMGAAADILCGIAALWYVLLRFGTISALEPRYAVLCFQFAIGIGILFAYFAVNIVMLTGFRFTY